jgi:flavin-binding protein dodecin
MAESVYKVVELIGTGTESWEKAARAAVERASKTLRDLRVAEVVTRPSDRGWQGHGLSRQRDRLPAVAD